MKLLSILLFAIHIIAYSNASSLDDYMKKVIKEIKDKIPEPINITSTNINIPENAIISGTLHLSNFVASGLKAMDLSVKVTDILGLPTAFSFKLDKFRLDTEYNMDIPIFNLPILTVSGNGNLSLSLSGLSVKGSINVLAVPNIFSEVTTSLNNDTKFEITGFMDDSRFSEQLSNDLSEIIISTLNDKELGEFLKDIMNKLVEEIINGHGKKQINYEKDESSISTAEENVDDFNLLNAFEILVINLLQLSNQESPSDQ